MPTVAQGFHKTFLLKSQEFLNTFSPLSFLPFLIALYFLIRTLCVFILCQNSQISNLLDKKKTVFDNLNKNMKVYAPTCVCIYIYLRNMYRTSVVTLAAFILKRRNAYDCTQFSAPILHFYDFEIWDILLDL